MGLQIGGALDHTFDDPIDLMRDCHRRIERFLAQLARVAERGGGSLTAMERDGLDQSLRYFDGMAPKHTADEEDSLFPRLRQRLVDAQDAAGLAVLERMAELEADHQAAGSLHEVVEALGRRWLADDSLPAEQASEFATAIASLQALYSAHIDHEDNEVFPLAQRVLSPREQAEIGREMAARRGNLTCSQRKALEG